jgi:hypothetical protein
MRSFREILRNLLFVIIIFCLVMISHSCEDDSQWATPSVAPVTRDITQTEAYIDGIVFCATSVYFEYGNSTSYGNTISGGTFSFKYESSVAHAHLTSLNPNTTYHFRGVAKNKHKTYYSGDHTFTTLP